MDGTYCSQRLGCLGFCWAISYVAINWIYIDIYLEAPGFLSNFMRVMCFLLFNLNVSSYSYKHQSSPVAVPSRSPAILNQPLCSIEPHTGERITTHTHIHIITNMCLPHTIHTHTLKRLASHYYNYYIWLCVGLSLSGVRLSYRTVWCWFNSRWWWEVCAGWLVVCTALMLGQTHEHTIYNNRYV